MKRTMVFIILTACVVVLQGCPTYDDLLRTKKLESISVDLSGAKTSFVKNGAFSSEGVVLKGHYSDGTTKVEPVVLAKFSGFDSSTVTDAVLITVVYENCTTQYPVAILDSVLVGIEIQEKPLKKVYYKGDSLDLTGLIVMGAYSNGASTDVTKDCIVSGFDPMRSGTQLISVKHPLLNDITKTFPIFLSESELKDIAVTNSKEVYVVGSEFDYSKLEVQAVYVDGAIPLSKEQYKVSGFDSSSPMASQTITVTVNTFTKDFVIKIVSAEWATIAVKDLNGMVSKPLGTVVDFITVVKKYSDGTVKNDEVVPPESYTISPAVLTQTGVQAVTVTYAHPQDSDILLPSYFESTITFQVYVTDSQLTGIEITLAKQSFAGYTENTGPNISDFTVTGVYSDSSREPLTDYCTVAYDPVPEAGATAATVKALYYDGSLKTQFTASIDVPILPRQISGIAVSQLPTRSQYIAGETFDLTGLKLKLLYSNGTSDEIRAGTDNCTYAPPLTTKLTVGTSIVTVTHTASGKMADIPITVTAARLTGLTLAYSGSMPSYPLGSGPDASHFKVTGTYTDDSKTFIPNDYCAFKYEPPVTEIGVANVVASYYDTTQKKTFESAPVEVNIKDVAVQSIAIKTHPAKLNYAQGEPFDPAGLVIEHTYDDGTTKTVAASAASDFSYNPPLTTKLTVGTSIVTVTHTASGKTADIPITVTAARLTGLTLAYSGSMPSYPLGSGPDASHFKVTGVYTDVLHTEDLTPYCILAYVSPPTSTGPADVTATYADASQSGSVFTSDKLSVTITAATVEKIMVLKNPSKTEYAQSEPFDPAGLVIVKKFTDGSVVAASSELTYSFTDISNTTTSNFSSMIAGSVIVTVTCAGTTTTFEVTVKNV